MAQPPNRGFDPNKLNGLANRLNKLPTLGRPAWGMLIDQIKDAADRNDSAALDLALESLGSAYAILSAVVTDMQALSAALGGLQGVISGRLNSLEARVTALERRP